VVNNVGVNLNTASFFLLKYVSGINSSLAKKIVNYRDANGRITSRDELKKVPGMGPKSYEQSAGFLKIPESPNPLDNTWVHPENYALATEIRALIAKNLTVTAENRKAFKETYSVGDTTIDDIVNELKKPNRDPREGFPKPLMQKGVVNFEDLKEAMVVTGKVKNVVDFGAFVDIGIKETALLHISEMSDTYVEDPMDVLKVGDVKEFRIIGLDLDRRRISLSLKSDKPQAKTDAGPARTEGSRGDGSRPEARGGQPARGPGDRQDTRGYQGGNGQRPGRPDGRRDGRQDGRASGADAKRYSAREDDGTTYNPFAEAFKKAKK
jgi:protein Tex